MTRKEAIRFLELDKKDRGKCFISDAIDMAIEALEQELILEKIKDKIEQMDFDFGDFYDHTRTIREMVLEVIDKCKGENE